MLVIKKFKKKSLNENTCWHCKFSLSCSRIGYTTSTFHRQRRISSCAEAGVGLYFGGEIELSSV